MRKHVSIIAATVLLLSAAAAMAQPGIKVEPSAFNFGKVAQHTDVNHTFWVKSIGTEPLVITKVVPGCGCTKMPLADTLLAPGDSTALEIIFSTKSYRGFVTKKPYIETNAGEPTYFTINAELLPQPETMTPIKLEPYKLDVSQFTSTPRRKATFKIHNVSDQPYEINLIDDDDKKFDVDMPKKVGPGEVVEGTVTVHEDAIESEFGQSITFEINDEEGSRFSLPVKRIYRIKR